MGKGERYRRKRRQAVGSSGYRLGGLVLPVPAGEISYDTGDCVDIRLIPRNILTAVVPIIMREDSVVRPLGTAFSIAHFSTGYSLFVTARHVAAQNLPPQPDVEILALLPVQPEAVAGSHHLTGARTIQIGIADLDDASSDVALLAVDRRTAPLPLFDDWRSMPISFRKPGVGKKCLALGYSDAAIGPLTGDVGSELQAACVAGHRRARPRE